MEMVRHLSHFGTSRLGHGTGTLDAAENLSLEISFSDEPEGTYRAYECTWIGDDTYKMVSTQFSDHGAPTGNWYGGTFIRLER